MLFVTQWSNKVSYISTQTLMEFIADGKRVWSDYIEQQFLQDNVFKGSEPDVLNQVCELLKGMLEMKTSKRMKIGAVLNMMDSIQKINK